MNLDRSTVLKRIASLGLIIIAAILFKIWGSNSNTLQQYASENPDLAYREADTGTQVTESAPEEPPVGTTCVPGETESIARITYQSSFYYEPLSDNLRRYITGVSYPENMENMVISYDNLRYVHVLHYDFEGNPAEGELICNEKIAQDLVEIFYELYRNQYEIEKIRLIDEYDGDDLASMEDNNTSCFNYRLVEGTSSLSKHAYGLALDINPFYNPYVTFGTEGEETISPVSASVYADRSLSFPYKINENDLCYKLFTEYGFTWGGNWNSSKDYQHFQKNMNN